MSGNGATPAGAVCDTGGLTLRFADGAPVLDVQGLSVGYRQPQGEVLRVAAGVDLKLLAGQVLGLAGESGCGKSTAALAAVGYRHPGGVILAGRSLLGETDLLQLPQATLRALWGGRVAYISQNAAASLDPSMTVTRHFDEVLSRHARLRGAAAAARKLELLESVHIPDPPRALERYPHQLSGGQQQRVSLALAFACHPAALILDEPTTGLDVTTQTQITALLRSLIAETNVAVMYVSHDLALLSTVATDVAVMYAGEIVERGAVQALVTAPFHPYTHALLHSVPSARGRQAISGIPGEPPVKRERHELLLCAALPVRHRPLSSGASRGAGDRAGPHGALHTRRGAPRTAAHRRDAQPRGGGRCRRRR